MRSFKDNANRVWTVAINVATAKRVRAETQVDLLDLFNPQRVQPLADDPVALVDTLFSVVRPQAISLGVSDEAFAEAITGDVLDAAVTALLGAVADFFPSRKAALLTKLLAKAEAAGSTMLTRMEQAIDALDPSALADAPSSGSAPNSPGSAGSIPTP